MSAENITFLCILSGFFGFVIFIAGFGLGFQAGRNGVEKEAIINKAASYRPNEDGDPEFYWLTGDGGGK